MDPPMRGEELHRFVYVQLERLADRLAAPGRGELLAVEARAGAGIAHHLHVRQKAHLDRLHPLALAFRAATARRIEREAARGESAHARRVGLRIQAPDGIPESHACRATARGLSADRRQT